MIKLIRNRETLAPLLVFTAYGIMFSSWFVYIPFVKSDLHIDQVQLAMAIFFMSVAGIIMLPFCPSVIKRFGTVNSTGFTIVAFILSVGSLPFVTSYTDLCTRMFISGLLASSSNVTMNSLVVLLEHKLKVNLLSSCHACFSMGCIIGSGLGSLVLLTNISKTTHLVFLMVVLCLTILYVIKTNTNNKEEKVGTITKPKAVTSWSYIIKMLVPVIIIYFIMMSEGAMADWSGLYIRGVVKGPSWSYSLAYGMFSAAMCLGRLFGDKLTSLFKSRNIIMVNFLISAAGLALIMTKILSISLSGFFLTGIGFSLIVPLTYRDASRNTSEPSRAIAILSGAGSIGFLTGPLIFGFLGHLGDLRLSFLFILSAVVLCLVTVLIFPEPQSKIIK